MKYMWSRSGFCMQCLKPLEYAGDRSEGEWKAGKEPYCICDTEICKGCGRMKDKVTKQHYPQ